MSRATPLAFAAGVTVGSVAAYYFAIRPLTLAAELSAQAGFWLIQARARPKDGVMVGSSRGADTT